MERLNEIEQAAIDLTMNGYNSLEIALMLHVPHQSIYDFLTTFFAYAKFPNEE